MKNRKGFTITELVIVIAVIAILAAVLIPTFSSVIKKANESAVLQEAKNLHTAYQAAVNYAAGETAEATGLIKVVKGGDTYYVAIANGSVDSTAVHKNTQPSVAPGKPIISAAENENGVTWDPAPCSASNATCVDSSNPADGKCDVCTNTMPAA